MTDENQIKLVRFAALVLQESRECLADLDGAWLQETAEKVGLLVSVEAQSSCGDSCRCADYGAFPQPCLRYAPGVREIVDAAMGGKR